MSDGRRHEIWRGNLTLLRMVNNALSKSPKSPADFDPAPDKDPDHVQRHRR